MNKPLPQPVKAPALPPDAHPELVSLSKRLTQRAAAAMARTDPRVDYGHLSLEAEADHIAALRRYIISKETVVDRFREQLERFPNDIATLRDRLAIERDAGTREIIARNLEAYTAMQDTLQHRVEVFDATWPDRKAEMLAAIVAHETRRAGSGGHPG